MGAREEKHEEGFLASRCRYVDFIVTWGNLYGKSWGYFS